MERDGERPYHPKYGLLSSTEVRSRLLTHALEFTRSVREIDGVRRIALLGSIVTSKPFPKDVDLLLTIVDGLDLAGVARLSRRLQGQAQGLNSTADVFLADPSGHYLGRTCHWRQCAPGIRMACDALHCGRRTYLHDDLETVRLGEELVRTPPVELWPTLVRRVEVPEDVDQLLLTPLRNEGPAPELS